MDVASTSTNLTAMERFYEGKSLFITGATGFVAKVRPRATPEHWTRAPFAVATARARLGSLPAFALSPTWLARRLATGGGRKNPA